MKVIFEKVESSTVGDHHLGHDISAAPEGIAFSRGWEMDDVEHTIMHVGAEENWILFFTDIFKFLK